MTLQNNDCNYIKISSEQISNISQYKSISVKLKKNCCSDLTYNSEITIAQGIGWNIKLFKTTDEVSTNIIAGFYIKNIYTGEEEFLELDYGYNLQNCTLGFSDIEADINAWLTLRGIVNPVTVSSSTDLSGYCVMIINGLSGPFVMTKMVYNITSGGNTDYERFFTFGQGSTGFFFSGDTLYIGPEIVDTALTAFTDGVYSVDITYTLKNNSTISESSCIFLDCTIKCLVAAKIDTIETDTLLHIMYFSLLEASGCACECDKLCKLYEKILVELDIITLTSNCGC